MKLRDLRRLLALTLPIELAYEITSYLVQSDIRRTRDYEYEFIPRVRHRHLLDRFTLDIYLD